MTARHQTAPRPERARCFLAAFFAAALALLALGAFAPTSAHAAEVTEPIVIEDPAQALEGDGWKWESSGPSGTLTLTNATIRIPSGTASSAIVVPDGATIFLVGENSVVLDAASTAETHYAGIESEGDLTITSGPSSSLAINVNSTSSRGISCAGDLTVGTAELDVSAIKSDTVQDLGSEGIFAGGNVIINDGATLAATGSAYGLFTEGGLNITDAKLVKFGVEYALSDSRSLRVAGETIVSDVSDEVMFEGDYATFEGAATISNTVLTARIDSGRGAIEAHNGLDIVDRARVSMASPGIVLDVTGCLFVQNADLRSEGIGENSTAVRVMGDLAVDNGAVTALGDEDANTAGIEIVADPADKCERHLGILTLSSNPAITAEGTHFAIALWSSEEAWNRDPVVLDPTIGALEGGMLSYAERDYGDGEFASVWTYATGKPSLGSEHAIDGASQRVTIGMESALVFVTNEGQPVSGLESVRATAADGTVYDAVEWLDGSHSGYYRFPRALPDGTYDIEASDDSRAVSATATIGELPSTVIALELCPSKRFADIDTAQWYHESIDWAIVNNVLRGIGGTNLMAPETAITRAQLATMLWNAAGNPAPQEDAPFADVPADEWYAQAIDWTYEKGIFKGYAGTDLFGPEDALSREQAAAIMMRWEQSRGESVSTSSDLSSFSDASTVSDWAYESVSWAVSAGIIKGIVQADGTTVLMPQSDCSRAQLATILMRALDGAPTNPVA